MQLRNPCFISFCLLTMFTFKIVMYIIEKYFVTDALFSLTRFTLVH